MMGKVIGTASHSCIHCGVPHLLKFSAWNIITCHVDRPPTEHCAGGFGVQKESIRSSSSSSFA